MGSHTINYKQHSYSVTSSSRMMKGGDAVNSRLLNSLFGNFNCDEPRRYGTSASSQYHHNNRCESNQALTSPIDLFHPFQHSSSLLMRTSRQDLKDDRRHYNDNKNQEQQQWDDDHHDDDDELYHPSSPCSSPKSTCSSKSCSSSSSSLSSTNHHHRVTFDVQVEVVEIPSHRDYPQATKRRMWNSLAQIKQNMERNCWEFSLDGWDWRKATEEDHFQQLPSGELVHPATWRRIAKALSPPQLHCHNNHKAASSSSSSSRLIKTHKHYYGGGTNVRVASRTNNNNNGHTNTNMKHSHPQ